MTLNNILTHEYKRMSKDERLAYIEEHGEMKVLTTYGRESWDDVQFTAYKLGCRVARGFDADLAKVHKFNEYYIFTPKGENK